MFLSKKAPEQLIKKITSLQVISPNFPKITRKLLAPLKTSSNE